MNVQALVTEAKDYFSSEAHVHSLIASIQRYVNDSDWKQVPDTDETYGYESWVELGYGQPGDLEPEPVVIFAYVPTNQDVSLQRPTGICRAN